MAKDKEVVDSVTFALCHAVKHYNFKRCIYNRHLSSQRIAIDIQVLHESEEEMPWMTLVTNAKVVYEERTYSISQIVQGEVTDETKIDYSSSLVSVSPLHLLKKALESDNFTAVPQTMFDHLGNFLVVTKLLELS